MKEYGAVRTKLVKIPLFQQPMIQITEISQQLGRFLCFSRNGKFLMHTKNTLVLYSSKEDTFEYLPIPGGEILPYDYVHIKTHVDSLISPNRL